MKECPDCKNKIPREAKFCSFCGYNFSKQEEFKSDLVLLQETISQQYSILKNLGKGGTATIFYGLSKENDTPVVIKLLNKEHEKNPLLKEMFIHGIKVNQKIIHPNIVKIFDTGFVGERPYFIMEYAKIGPLSWLLKTYPRAGMPIRQSISILLKILSGLQAIHDHQIVHRNLKPDSIFILSDGEPIIGDFSISKVGNRHTGSGISGTLHYMSPEQCLGLEDIDHRSDLYSVGIMLYELLTGELPFSETSERVLINKQVNEPLPDIFEKLLSRGLKFLLSYEDLKKLRDLNLNGILQKACDKDKNKRYSSAIAFATDLQNLYDELHKKASPKPLTKKTALSGFNPDNNYNLADKLGINSSVQSFSRLIASRSLTPPLSIGLFGSWGSGKTFFMKKLTKEIETLSSEMKKELEAGKKQKDLPFYAKIVQIHFKAWHFMDGNFWASFVDHLFSNLKLAGEPGDSVEKRRNLLIQEIEKEKKGLDILESQIQDYAKEEEKLREELEQQKHNYTHEIKNVFAIQLNEEIAKKLPPAEVKKWFEKAGIPYKEDEPLSAQLYTLYKETDQFKNLPLWQMLKRRYRAFLYLGLIALLIALGLLTYSLVHYFYGNLIKDFFQGISLKITSWLTSILTVFAPIIGFWNKIKTWMSKNLNWSEKFTEKVKLVFPNLQKELDKKEQEQEKKEKEILEKREKLNQDKAGLEEKVQNLEAELETTSHENYLSNFIEEKGGGDSYKKYLGIITQIRNDFQKLSSLLTNYNQSLEAEDNTSADNTYLVNRIVLYIDDLDRLPPEKVLQTIQAIRLLLSFEAFVVVVSVDSKWLSGVLNANFRQIFGDSSSRDTEGDGQVDLYRTSSYDYLEKIFQIPLWLTPMNLEGRQNLLNYLMEKDLLVAHGLAEDMEKAVKATQEFNSLTGSSLPEQSLPEEKEKIQILSKDWSFAEPDEKQFRIQKREHEFSLKIAPLLGRFPRSLKRFVNIYRLIKVGLSKLQWEVYFLDINPVTGYSGREGTVRNFEVVMFLLAVITGLPYTSRVFFRTLKLSEKDNLKDLLEKIGVIKTEKSWDILGVKREEVLFSGNKITNSPGNKNPDFLSLQAEFIHLTSWLDKNANQKWMNLELDQLRYWEPHVSRYSFRVEPIMFGDE